MATICPTVTAEDLHTYRSQLERIEQFASRIHLDFMDGLFTSNKSVDLQTAWLPKNTHVDLHLMYMRPDLYLSTIKKLQPSLVIVHAEAKGDYRSFAASLKQEGVKTGVCLLQDTPVSLIQEHLDMIDHVLIFSGNLGHFGGNVNTELLKKVASLKQMRPDLEIGWDGGVNDKNAKQLVRSGVDVLNVGGFIQKAKNPKEQYEVLVAQIA
jgi:ribulose-phosphate 3-epimerase